MVRLTSRDFPGSVSLLVAGRWFGGGVRLERIMDFHDRNGQFVSETVFQRCYRKISGRLASVIARFDRALHSHAHRSVRVRLPRESFVLVTRCDKWLCHSLRINDPTTVETGSFASREYSLFSSMGVTSGSALDEPTFE